MSGRTAAPTTDDGTEHRDPAEFLNADGSFDVASAKQVSNQSVDPDECATLRRQVRGASDVDAVDTDWSHTAVRRHVRGRCSCPVTVPALEYDLSANEWVEADE